MSDENSIGTSNNKNKRESSRSPTPNGLNTSNTDKRPSCKYGRQCFRKNPKHRIEMAHPGDVDYIVPDMPEPNDDAPDCSYGRKCYRLNPEHFKNFKHPRNINIQQNYRRYCLNRRGTRRNSDSSFDYNFSDDENVEDPFAGGSDDSDYHPSCDEE